MKNKTPNNKICPTIELVYTQETGKLRQFIRNKINDPHRVEDLLQEVYLRLTKAPELKTAGEIKAYTYRITSNLINDFWRQNQRYPNDTYPSDDAIFELPSSDLESDIANRETLRSLRIAFEELPEQCRRIFWLNRYEGLTYSEIAAQLNVSVSWVEKNMMKAISHCRAVLQED